MYSIAALIEPESREPWQSFISACDSSEMAVHPSPHFSWQTAENYALEEVRHRLEKITRSIPPFRVISSGLGIFSNAHKTLFLILAKTRFMMDIHEMLWKELIPYTEEPKQYYSPERWIPHVSLNLYPLSEGQINRSFEKLVNQGLYFEFQIKQFGLLYLTEKESGVDQYFTLEGKTVNE